MGIHSLGDRNWAVNHRGDMEGSGCLANGSHREGRYDFPSTDVKAGPPKARHEWVLLASLEL